MNKGLQNPNAKFVLIGGENSGKEEVARAAIGSQIETESEIERYATQHFSISVDNTSVTLLRTPDIEMGSSAGTTSMDTILSRLLEYLEKNFPEDTHIDGVLFCYPITRYGGSGTDEGILHERHLSAIKDLCNSTNLERLTIVTTFWENTTQVHVVQERKFKNKPNRLKGAFDQGAKSARFPVQGNQDSAFEILRAALAVSNHKTFDNGDAAHGVETSSSVVLNPGPSPSNVRGPGSSNPHSTANSQAEQDQTIWEAERRELEEKGEKLLQQVNDLKQRLTVVTQERHDETKALRDEIHELKRQIETRTRADIKPFVGADIEHTSDGQGAGGWKRMIGRWFCRSA